jgi:uncharacterized coiled-coil DUF342 family protein
MKNVMELNEQITALKAENKQYLDMIDGLNAEKLALDQMIIDSLKQVLSVKKDIILSNKKLFESNEKINGLIKEIESLKKPSESPIEL